MLRGLELKTLISFILILIFTSNLLAQAENWTIKKNAPPKIPNLVKGLQIKEVTETVNGKNGFDFKTKYYYTEDGKLKQQFEFDNKTRKIRRIVIYNDNEQIVQDSLLTGRFTTIRTPELLLGDANKKRTYEYRTPPLIKHSKYDKHKLLAKRRLTDGKGKVLDSQIIERHPNGALKSYTRKHPTKAYDHAVDGFEILEFPTYRIDRQRDFVITYYRSFDAYGNPLFHYSLVNRDTVYSHRFIYEKALFSSIVKNTLEDKMEGHFVDSYNSEGNLLQKSFINREKKIYVLEKNSYNYRGQLIERNILRPSDWRNISYLKEKVIYRYENNRLRQVSFYYQYPPKTKINGQLSINSLLYLQKVEYYDEKERLIRSFKTGYSRTIPLTENYFQLDDSLYTYTEYYAYNEIDSLCMTIKKNDRKAFKMTFDYQENKVITCNYYKYQSDFKIKTTINYLLVNPSYFAKQRKSIVEEEPNLKTTYNFSYKDKKITAVYTYIEHPKGITKKCWLPKCQNAQINCFASLTITELDLEGKIIGTEEYEYNKDSIAVYAKIDKTYKDNFNRKALEVHQINNQKKHITYFYDQNNKLTKTVEEHYNTDFLTKTISTFYKNDRNGNMLEERIVENTTITIKTKQRFNHWGQLTYQIKYNDEGYSETTNTYDDNGALLHSITKSHATTVEKIKVDKRMIDIKNRIPVLADYPYFVETLLTKHTYDDKGNLTIDRKKIENKILMERRYEYDEQGAPTKVILKERNWKRDVFYEYVYY